jgi:tetratricopeptide (TPR) repeat protein
MRVVERLLAIFALSALCLCCAAQDPGPEKLTPDQIANRDALLKPGIDALKRGDNAAAVDALQPALAAYPDDLRVLRYTASAAMGANQNEKALDLFNRALAEHPNQPWPLRLAVLQLEARLEKWPAFDRDLAALRAAKKSGTDHQLDSSNGFIMEEFDAGGKHVQAVVFPLLAGGYHTLYRFLLPKLSVTAPPVQASTQSPRSSRCDNPDFRPYIDVESDDVDQEPFRKAHPDLAAKGERSYSLDTYGAPCSQGLIKFYFDGEPAYESVRADVIKALTYTPKPAAANPDK